MCCTTEAGPAIVCAESVPQYLRQCSTGFKWWWDHTFCLQVLMSQRVVGKSKCLWHFGSKSNSTAGAMQVKANLQEQLSDNFHFQILYFEKNRSRSLGVNFELLSFFGNVKNIKICKDSHKFLCRLLHFRGIKLFTFLPSKSRSRSRVQFSQWHYLMASVKIYKRLRFLR